MPINVTVAQPLYVLAAGQSLSSSTGDYLFYFADIPSVDLVVENRGTVTVSGGSYASAFLTKAEPGYGYFFRNYGTLSVTAAGEAQAGEFGRFQNYGEATITSAAPRASEDMLDNFGHLSVRGVTSAHGVLTYTPGQTFTNGAGARFEVSASAATGFAVAFMFKNGGGVINAGDIIISGGQGAEAVDVYHADYGSATTQNSYVQNSGLIQATVADSHSKSIAIRIIGEDFRLYQPTETFLIVNSGTIIADTAILEEPMVSIYGAWMPLTLQNTGTIRGDIVLGKAAYAISNSGLIAGDIQVDGVLTLNGAAGTIDGAIVNVFGPSVVHSGLGDDLIYYGKGPGNGAAGTPLIDGGAGVDTVNFNSPYAWYHQAEIHLTYVSPGAWTFAADDGFKANLVSIEHLALADADLHLGAKPPPSDFNADGKADALWRNTSGELYVWNSQSGQGAFLGQSLGGVDTSWRVVDVADYSGDGKADILWRNTNGDVYVYKSNPGAAVGFTGQSISYVDTTWQIVPQAGDFNGDGRADILWRSTANGEVYVWNSNSGADVSFTGQSLGVVDSFWGIKAVGDFNGDGRADVLWRNTDGDVYVWKSAASGPVAMTGQSISHVDTTWVVQGVGDFNGDGRDDILWRSTANSEVYVWNSNQGPDVSFAGQSLGIVDSFWSIAAIADYDGDGRADILWRNTNGDLYLWNSNDTGPVGFRGQGLGTTPTNWHILSDFHGM